ncbi:MULTISPECIES: acylphosphatase [Dactylosporangium]|uniref:Acylphosphatase n=2 Tax=Dactylosporangium TaxID=35753 RepID=A0A9W6KWR5_9ACTN|nr:MULTISPECIES: acylphosphatase [Dactylosporangium]UAB99385.1 acylphosphatase [Dactylosporangium vinaceum]UWZ47611.1 acylphosphatase [Dactylosporangium matsuzakiense]GLL08733.1 acylphosphatase [Dactylosporangium matsuzakiense]
MIRTRVVISGRVQGVYFRDTCRRVAREHGVAGWVRNLPDGRVEAVFEGTAEAVAAMVTWSGEGPPEAAVTGVSARDEPVEALQGFEIRR